MHIYDKIKKWFSLSSTSTFGNINQIPSERWNEFYACFPQVSYQALLGYPATRHAIEIISGLCGELSVNQYARTKSGREKETDSWGYWCLNREPNPYWRPSAWKKQYFAYYTAHGQVAAQIVRDEWTADPLELRLIDPQSWIVETNLLTGNPKYSILTTEGWKEISPADLLLMRDLGDTIRGYNLVQIAHEALKHSLNLQKFASKFFENGRMGSEWIELPPGFNDENKRVELIKKIRETYAGIENAWKQFYVPAGTKVNTSTVDNENGQMLASQQHDLVNIANLFNLPASYLNANINTSFKSLEEESRTLLKSLNPMLVQFEEECSRKLLKESDFRLNRRYFEVARVELIQLDTEAQKRIAREEWLAGQINFEEMREMDNRPTDTEGLWCIPENIRVMDKMAPKPEPPVPEPNPEPAADMPMEAPEKPQETAEALTRNILGKIKTRLEKAIEAGKTDLEPHREIILAQLSAWQNAGEWVKDFLGRIETELKAVLPEQRKAVIAGIDIEEELKALCK